MFTYTTCRDCGDILHVTSGDTVHEGCTPRPTKVERYSQQWLDAVLAEDTEEEHRLHAMIENLDTAPPRMLAAALTYISWGWPVFPLKPVGTQCVGGDKCMPICQCPKTPATRNGFKNSTTDPAKVREFWGKRPNCNIGLATGHLFDVFDIDPSPKVNGVTVPGAGTQSYLKLIEQQRIPDVHGVTVTSSGGMHLYLTPTGATNSNSAWKDEFPGLDFRGIGGYVCAPPTTLGTRGRSWSWLVKPSPRIKGELAKNATS